MTVTIARTIVTAPLPNQQARNQHPCGWRPRRATWLRAASLACSWVWLSELGAQEAVRERFDLHAEPAAVTSTLEDFYGRQQFSLRATGKALISRDDRARTAIQPVNPLRRAAAVPTAPVPGSAESSGMDQAAQADQGSDERWLAQQPRPSSEGKVTIQDLPPTAKQVAHAEAIRFENLPSFKLAQQGKLIEEVIPSAELGPLTPELNLRSLPASPGEFPLSARRLDYEGQTEDVGSRMPSQPGVQELEQPTAETWWRVEVAQPFCGLPQNEPLDLGTLIQLTLRGSPYLQAISQEPLVREEDTSIARADFDPVLFARTLYDDRTDPVGNTLTTGGLPFLKDNIWTGQAGVRRKYFTGGKVEASQLLGFQNSNSRFFVPQDQGTATLAINLQQPLLRGAGQAYNRSQIVIAQLNAGASWDQVSGLIQEELARSVTAYWDLYAKRAVYLQMLRNLERSQAILKRLEARAEYDVQALQLAQARAAVTSRRVQLANALRDVRNAETEIRQIVGDAQLIDSDQIELLTIEPPQEVVEPLVLSQTVEVALANRPEIREAMNKLKAAAVRNDVTRNEMLPDLSLLFGTYVKGLKGDSALGQAWEQQFVNSTPGYSAGLQYEFPWRNRAAISRNRQNRLEYVRYQNELERWTLTVIGDTQKSFRTLNSGIETLASAQVALDAALAELKQLEVRWDAFPLVEGDWFEGQTQSLLLDQLLAAQQKVTDHEREVTLAELEMKKAQINLKRSMGIVLDYYQVSTETAVIDGLPQVEFNASGATQQPLPSLPPEDGATAPIQEPAPGREIK